MSLTALYSVGNVLLDSLASRLGASFTNGRSTESAEVQCQVVKTPVQITLLKSSRRTYSIRNTLSLMLLYHLRNLHERFRAGYCAQTPGYKAAA
jgi:hypothetical protein